ncbi:hypothetical protein [Spiroplasma mirum]|uniref:hypothetical protein n=1 Tax=Spiroplasma mirum TaxID=2144 RepID=UPI0003DFC3FF|nr:MULTISPECIES: hypothetical protein [Spiroplasma]AHF60719.1 hypothetical protein SMM_0268 [Spiroplasma mirum ATCC 29335]AKM52837.1 hypothetical protein SATRI_v1c03100 [Spiroplasma atrichopogonis]
MSIFDKNENEKYAYFLTNFKELVADWVVMVGDPYIKTALDTASIKLFGMNVEKAMSFFDIDLHKNQKLLDIGAINEVYSLGLLNDIELEHNKKSKKKPEVLSRDTIYDIIDKLFEYDSDVLRFCEYTLNVVLTVDEAEQKAITAINNYRSIAFMNYSTRIFELIEWFGIMVNQVTVNGLNAHKFGSQTNEPSNSHAKKNVNNFRHYHKKNVQENGDDLAPNKEQIFTEYFSYNGNIKEKIVQMKKILPLLNEKREELKEFNPKLEYEIFNFLNHAEYRPAITVENKDYEKVMDKVFKKAVLCLYLLEME